MHCLKSCRAAAAVSVSPSCSRSGSGGSCSVPASPPMLLPAARLAAAPPNSRAGRVRLRLAAYALSCSSDAPSMPLLLGKGTQAEAGCIQALYRWCGVVKHHHRQQQHPADRHKAAAWPAGQRQAGGAAGCARGEVEEVEQRQLVAQPHRQPQVGHHLLRGAKRTDVARGERRRS